MDTTTLELVETGISELTETVEEGKPDELAEDAEDAGETMDDDKVSDALTTIELETTTAGLGSMERSPMASPSPASRLKRRRGVPPPLQSTANAKAGEVVPVAVYVAVYSFHCVVISV